MMNCPMQIIAKKFTLTKRASKLIYKASKQRFNHVTLRTSGGTNHQPSLYGGNLIVNTGKNAASSGATYGFNISPFCS